MNEMLTIYLDDKDLGTVFGLGKVHFCKDFDNIIADVEITIADEYKKKWNLTEDIKVQTRRIVSHDGLIMYAYLGNGLLSCGSFASQINGVMDGGYIATIKTDKPIRPIICIHKRIGYLISAYVTAQYYDKEQVKELAEKVVKDNTFLPDNPNENSDLFMDGMYIISQLVKINYTTFQKPFDNVKIMWPLQPRTTAEELAGIEREDTDLWVEF